MRIDPNARVGAPATRRSGRLAGAAGGAFARSLDAEAPAPTGGTASTSVVEGLLAFQEVEDATSGLRRRAWQRGALILDRLDELKLGLLGGGLSSERLVDLARLARSSRGPSLDPGLDEVLGEIELRAAVELAKLQRGE